MKPLSVLFGLHGCLLLLCSCHPSPSAPTQKAPKDTNRVDSTTPHEVRDTTAEAPIEHYDTLDPATRSHFSDILAFLNYIKRPNSDYDVGANRWLKNFKIGKIDSFMQFVTVDSLEITDANVDPDGGFSKYSHATLRQQLTNRKGEIFDMIGVISLHYTDPYPQYSHTKFWVDKADSIPNLNVQFSEFEMYFRAEQGSTTYKLYRLESDHIDDL